MENEQFIGQELDLLQLANYIICDADNVKNYIQKSHSNNTLNIISQNIRSITCNFPNFTTLLQRSQVTWDFVILTECWLMSSKSIPELDSYDFVTTSKHKTQNEGVAIYFRKQLRVEFEEPDISDANCLLVKLDSYTCIIGIYRPPSQHNITNFINFLEILLNRLKGYKNIILCGDINIDISPNGSDKRHHEYLNMLAGHSMLPGHSLPTHGKTCLDHMVIKTNASTTCFVIESSITGHESVALTLNQKILENGRNLLHYRIDFERLDQILTNLNLQTILDCTNVNVAADLLTHLLSSAIKESSKLIKTPKRKHISKPWITKGLLRCMRNRDNLYKKHKKDPNNETLKVTYKRYRNFCNSILRKVKRKYQQEEIENARDNSKKLWEVIKKISGSNKPKDLSLKLLKTDKPMESVNDVNRFFANVGQSLAEKVLNSNRFINSSQNVITHRMPIKSLLLLPTDNDEISTIIQGLRNNCAVGNDQISGRILKRYKYIITPYITHICNLAISSGIFPRAFKTALIKPIHKGGEPECVNNFRPISILPTLSKILERIMNNRLTSFLEDNHLLSSNQFGFRHGKSTNDAVHELVHSIISSLDEKGKCVTVFLDLAKAFDSVSIPYLLEKLERIGVRGLPLSLFRDYLSERKQRVKIDQTISDELTVSYGVPQGSILGPTLFLVYIDDLCRLQLKNGKIFTYADDTALFFSGNNWVEVFETAQMGFNSVLEWLRNNLLTLNVSKTKYIAFSPRANLHPPVTLNIAAHVCNPTVPACSCTQIQRTDKIKYLGVIIDQTLSFKPHIEILVTRLRKLIFIFRNMRHIANHQVIKMVYYALCQSLVEYCITSWGGAAKSLLIEVERAQRAILKVGRGHPFRYPTDALYREWDVLSVRKLFLLHIALKKHSQLRYNPELMTEKRRKGKVCQVKKFRTSLAQRFYCFLGDYIYNKINCVLTVYPLHKTICKRSVSKYLKSLSYKEVEDLLCITK